MPTPDLRHLHPDTVHLGEIILSAEVIDKRMQELAKEIAAEYRNKKLILVGLLTGAAWVTTDLLTRLRKRRPQYHKGTIYIP